VERIPKTTAYALRTPKATEAMTVKQRRNGISTEFTIDQPALFYKAVIRCRVPKSVYLQFSREPCGGTFNLTALTLRASDD
jgi:hypothetical protein